MLLNNFIKKLKQIHISKASYYNVIEFINLLSDYKNQNFEVEDLIILPFYIHENNSVFEIYDYELNIQTVDLKGNIDNYLLERTGKKLFLK